MHDKPSLGEDIEHPALSIDDFFDEEGQFCIHVIINRDSPDELSLHVNVATKEILSKQSQHSRRGLKLRNDWIDWHKAEVKMLNQMNKCKMFARNFILKINLPAECDIINAIWSYKEKLLQKTKKA
jgi:hypothetical protein